MVLINVDQCIIWDIVLAVGIKLKKFNHPSMYYKFPTVHRRSCLITPIQIQLKITSKINGARGNLMPLVFQGDDLIMLL